jgi:hypothetical protein
LVPVASGPYDGNRSTKSMIRHGHFIGVAVAHAA